MITLLEITLKGKYKVYAFEILHTQNYAIFGVIFLKIIKEFVVRIYIVML